jgi:hypothetical protein
MVMQISIVLIAKQTQNILDISVKVGIFIGSAAPVEKTLEVTQE